MIFSQIKDDEAIAKLEWLEIKRDAGWLKYSQLKEIFLWIIEDVLQYFKG